MSWLLRRNVCRSVNPPDENGSCLHVVGVNSLELQGSNTATQLFGLAGLHWAGFVHCPNMSMMQQDKGSDLLTRCGAARRSKCRAAPGLVQSECHELPKAGQPWAATLSYPYPVPALRSLISRLHRQHLSTHLQRMLSASSLLAQLQERYYTTAEMRTLNTIPRQASTFALIWSIECLQFRVFTAPIHLSGFAGYLSSFV